MLLPLQVFIKVIFLKMRFLENDTADHFDFNDSWQQNISSLWIHCPLWCVISKKISVPVGHRVSVSTTDRDRLLYRHRYGFVVLFLPGYRRRENAQISGGF